MKQLIGLKKPLDKTLKSKHFKPYKAMSEKFDPNKHIMHVNCKRPITPELEKAIIHMCELAYNMLSKEERKTAQNKALQSTITINQHKPS